jgi:hypothetical protein
MQPSFWLFCAVFTPRICIRAPVRAPRLIQNATLYRAVWREYLAPSPIGEQMRNMYPLGRTRVARRTIPWQQHRQLFASS